MRQVLRAFGRADNRRGRRVAIAVLVALALVGAAGAGSAPAALSVTTVDLGGSGFGDLAVNTALNRVYVTNPSAGSVTMVDGATNSVLGTFAAGANSRFVGVNSQTGRVYVSNSGLFPSRVSVFESSGSPVTDIFTDNPAFHIAVNETTNRVYVGDQFGGGLTRIDGVTNAFVNLSSGRASHAVVVNEATNVVYVSNALCCNPGNGVYAIDGTTGSQIAVTTPRESDFYYVAVDRTLNKVYVSKGCCSGDPGGTGVRVLDGSTLAPITSIPMAFPGPVAVDSQRHLAYVAVFGGDLKVIDTTTDTVVETVPLGASIGSVAVNEATGAAYALSGSTLYVIGGPSSGPVDVDGDGIDDAIDLAPGSPSNGFQDGVSTAGTVGTVPAGETVTVTDLPDPAGVHVVVGGTGTDPVTIAFTNPSSATPCGSVSLLPGSDVEVTCGSITVHVVAGSAQIPLSDDTSVSIDAGETATISISTGGSFTVQSVSGGDGKVTLTSNGVTSQVGASPTPINLWDFVGFSPPVDNGGVYNVAKAGSNIPLRWQLLSEAGAPITNLASATVSVAPIGCQGGAPTGPAEQLPASAGDLKNQGKGKYQLDWKTDKKLTGCKQMQLSLTGEGPITHTALFNFK